MEMLCHCILLWFKRDFWIMKKLSDPFLKEITQITFTVANRRRLPWRIHSYTFLEFNTKITLIAIWLMPYHVGKSDSMFLFNMKNIKIINDESSLGFLGGIDRDVKRTEEN